MQNLTVLAAIQLFLAAVATPAESQDAPSALDFVSAADFSQVALSPSGSFLALVNATTEEKCVDYTGQVSKYSERCGEDRSRYRATYKIILFDADKGQPVKALPLPEDYYVQWLEWANNDRLLAAIARRTTTNLAGTRGAMGGSRVISIPRGEGEYVTLFESSRAMSRANPWLSRVTNLLRNDPAHVLMPAYKIGDLDLWKVNIENGEFERVAAGKPGTFKWFTDNDGKPVLRFDSNLYGTKISVYSWSDEKQDWVLFKTFKLKNTDDEDDFEFTPITQAETKDQFYVISDEDENPRRSIKIFDIKTNEYVETVFEHERYDVGGAILDVGTGKYAGAWYYADRLQQEFLDSRAQAHFRGLNTFFNNKSNVDFLGFDKSGKKAVVFVSAPDNPGGYYLYDLAAARIDPIAARKTKLPEDQLGAAEILNISTRDGREITAYLTAPKNTATANPPPTIVMPHGGPEARDFYDYDPYVQYFVTRGYQVLQVNFRGSSGYGGDFAKAGYGEWGGVMQNDVTDAVLSLQQMGKAVPSHTCIVGFSYGGYVALYGAATTPDLYKCAVSVSGASDLVDSLNETKRQYGGDSETYEYWTKSIGDPKADEEKLTKRSPITYAEQIKIPVLLIHGEEDTIENVKQSQRMNKALKNAGADVEYLELEYEGHRYWRTKTEINVLTAIENFLSEKM